VNTGRPWLQAFAGACGDRGKHGALVVGAVRAAGLRAHGVKPARVGILAISGVDLWPCKRRPPRSARSSATPVVEPATRDASADQAKNRP